ncbi:hypothetical protein SY2F82_78120 [Streptomyces sp. Y2F8-2]|nr:hypothetical protein SY2F82_78120 [Streptomyces sp. Y2F8-2]
MGLGAFEDEADDGWVGGGEFDECVVGERLLSSHGVDLRWVMTGMPAGAAPCSRGALRRLRLHRAAAREINAHPDPTSGRAVGQGIRGDVGTPASFVTATR